ncbi:MAG: hypothetical protein AAFO58_09335 [Pseudomonadota bacterium]
MFRTLTSPVKEGAAWRLGAGAACLLALAACETPVATDAGDTQSAPAVIEENAQDIPRELSGDVALALASFETYCVRNVKTLARSLPLLQRDGYVEILRDGGSVAYGHPDGKPFFVLGGRNPQNPRFCAVGIENTAENKREVQRYVSGQLRMKRDPALATRWRLENVFWNGETRQIAFFRTDTLGDAGEMLVFGISAF